MRRLTPEDKCTDCDSVMLVPAQRVSGLAVPATADYVCLDCGRAYAWTENPPTLKVLVPVLRDDAEDDHG